MSAVLRSIAISLIGLALAVPVQATESIVNSCTNAGGIGKACTASSDCAGNAYATACVASDATGSRTCQVACHAGGDKETRDLASCAAGESCVAVARGAGFYCRPTRFRVDLNLVDQCVSLFLSGQQPAIDSRSECSLEANLARLIDQDGNGRFDIVDVDLCFKAFLDQPVCDPARGSCPESDLFACSKDQDCGRGLYCDPDQHACVRECGLFSSREPGIGDIERGCSGRLHACNPERGRCEPVSLAGSTCGSDRDCPGNGAYCFLGRCEPTCSRALDCPDDQWFCTRNGRCRAVPPPQAPVGFIFDPADYTVLSMARQLTVTPIQNTTALPLVVMNLKTKREVRNNPAVRFGYRMEVVYGLRDAPECRKAPSTWNDQTTRDCTIEPDEEFLTLPSPFGTITATDMPSVGLQLNTTNAARLKPGTYNAQARLVFDNGSMVSVSLQFLKGTPSGEYLGSFTAGLGRQINALNGGQPLPLSLRLKLQDSNDSWTSLLNKEGLGDTEELIITSRGQVVHGYLHAGASLPYALATANNPAANDIPVKGIYTPQDGLMRLVAVVDLPANHWIAEESENLTGVTTAAPTTGVVVANPFGRTIRRIITFMGSFDAGTLRFFGTYRERLSGMLPDTELTLDGQFTMQQSAADESPLPLADPLLAASAPATRFTSAAALANAESDRVAACGTNDKRSSAKNGQYPLFANLVEFRSQLKDALGALPASDPATRRSMLSLYDYLAGRVVLCDGGTDSSTASAPISTPTAACIPEQALRCGLATMRYVLLKGEISMADVLTTTAASQTLFCSETLPNAGCQTSAARAPGLRALQEHNRFFIDLAQATKFTADRDVSDAFFAVYRNQLNPFTQGVALEYQAAKLQSAVRMYDRLVMLFTTPDASAVLATWPMIHFATRGEAWLKQLRVILEDRQRAQAALVDLRRRVFAQQGDRFQLLGDHLAQQEYLLQVYLLALQQKWQGDDFVSTGRSSVSFANSTALQLQLTTDRNPLGLASDRVFFESSDPTRTNWRQYLSTLAGDDGRGGLLADVRSDVQTAVENLQSNLHDIDALQRQLFDARNGYEDTIQEICGPRNNDSAQACARMKVDFEAAIRSGADGQELTKRVEVSCDPSFSCSEKTIDITYRSTPQTVACPMNGPQDLSLVGQSPRQCAGGAIGALHAERRALLVSLKQAKKSLQDQNQLILNLAGNSKDSIAHMKILQGFQFTWHAIDTIYDAVMAGQDYLLENLSDLQKPAGCLTVVGFAFGTSCVGAAIGVAGKIPANITKFYIKMGFGTVWNRLEGILDDIGSTKELGALIDASSLEIKRMLAAQQQTVDTMEQTALALADNLRNEQELRLKAQTAANDLSSEVSFVLDHLVGRESGRVLLADHLVRRSSDRQRQMLNTAYRMVLAFSHRYNLSTAEENELVQRVYTAVTPDDVQGIVDTLLDTERTYCGREAIDCDAFNNLSVMRISLRDTMFPSLRDMVDPATGKVLTRGQQFHNIITSPEYLRRRVRGVWTTDQVELPFAISLPARELAGRSVWPLSPTQCNHVLDGAPDSDEAGTVAVNVVGRNLDNGAGRGVAFELVRGAVDQMRSCHPESVIRVPGTAPVLDFPIRTRVVGYAPQSAQGQQPSPASYISRSAELRACVNQPESPGQPLEPACWHNFARDRSLASPDWILTVPLRYGEGDGANAWLLGEGLTADDQPVIEDIVINLRYRSRPIQEL